MRVRPDTQADHFDWSLVFHPSEKRQVFRGTVESALENRAASNRIPKLGERDMEKRPEPFVTTQNMGRGSNRLRPMLSAQCYQRSEEKAVDRLWVISAFSMSTHRQERSQGDHLPFADGDMRSDMLIGS